MLIWSVRFTGLLGIAGLILVAACAKPPPAGDGSTSHTSEPAVIPPPGWLDHPQIAKDQLCAIGVSGPTLYAEDGIAQSKAQSLTELGRSIEVKIRSELNMTTEGGGEQFLIELRERAKLISETEVKNAQISSQWINPGGHPGRGEKGTVYTLACVPLPRISPSGG